MQSSESSKRVIEGNVALGLLGAMIFAGMPFLTVLRHQRPWSSLMLLAIAVACGARLLRTLRGNREDSGYRLLATRDATAVIAALLSCTAVATGMSWARGAAVVSVVFVLLIEVLRTRRFK